MPIDLSRAAGGHAKAANTFYLVTGLTAGGLAVAFFLSGVPPCGFLLAVATVFLAAFWYSVGQQAITAAGRLDVLAERHIGNNWPAGTVLVERVPTRDRVNLQLAVNALRADAPATPYGVGWFNAVRDAVANSKQPVPVRWTSLPNGLSGTEPCAENGVFFLRTPAGVPFLAYLVPGRYEVLAASAGDAKAGLAAVAAEMAARSVYRGRVLSVEPPEPTQETDPDFMIRFHDLPPVERSEIVLPDEVLQVVERNVLGLLRHAETLRKAGRNTRHGVLFHGPPGVGKTLVTKYLARACPDYTVILLTGRQLGLVRESCRLARLLVPAMVVIEDVDLIALDRERGGNTTLLHDLMDEMDGLGPKADVIFLLTTNRAKALEPALAARPGRVDQAIYFPLPDRDCRRRLFAHFGRRLDLSGVDVEPLLDRTDGASPAFIQELFRKAALFAAERGEASDPLRLTTADFDAAVRELVEFGGELTRNLLGFAKKKVGF